MTDVTELDKAVEAYVQHVSVEKGLSGNTVAAYRRDLAKYREFLVERGVVLPTQIAVRDVSEFLTWLRREPQNLSVRSAARVLVSVRGAHAFWLEEGITPQNCAHVVAVPKIGERLPKALEVGQIEAIIAAAGTDSPAGLRNAALLEFLYSTGARISEATGFDVDDLHAEEGVVRLFGKGSKERVVPIGSYALRAMDAYRVRARPLFAQKGKGTPAFFLNQRGGRLTRQSAWNILKEAAERAQVGVEVSPHTMRHSCATHMLEGGADVRVVQELLGHASVTTTQIYTKVTVDALREVYAISHPRALS